MGLYSNIVAALSPRHAARRLSASSGLDAATGVSSRNAGAVLEGSDLEYGGEGRCIVAKTAEGSSGPPRLEMRVNTGVPMLLNGFVHPVVIDMKGLTFQKPNTPVIADHDPKRRIGHTVSQSITADGFVVGEGVVSSSSPTAKEFLADSTSDDPFPFEMSIGARATSVEFIKAGTTGSVNGKSYPGPLYIARTAVAREFTVCTLGADPQTSVTVHSSETSTNMDPELKAWLIKRGYNPDDVAANATLLADLTLSFKASTAPTATPVQATAGSGNPAAPATGPPNGVDLTAANEAHANNALRLSRIGQLMAQYPDAATFNLGTAEAPQTVDRAGLQAAAIRGNWTPEATELHLLRADRPSAGQVNIHSRHGMSDVTAEGIEIACLRAVGIPDSDEASHNGRRRQWGLRHVGYTDAHFEASDHRSLRGIGLGSLLDWTLQAAGRYSSSPRGTDDYFLDVLEADQFARSMARSNRNNLQASGSFSTINVSYILENVAKKVLLANYQLFAGVWEQVFAVRSVDDFKPHTSYTLDIGGGYRKVGPTGELSHGQLIDDKRSIRAETFGMMMALSRQIMINDDLNAFARIPAALGRNAALTKEEECMKLVLNASFYSTANGNLIDAPLSVEGFGAAKESFALKVDRYGRPILAGPDRLLVGTTNETLAGQIFKDTQFPTVVVDVNGTLSREFTSNPHAGIARPVMSPYLNNTAIRDQDGRALVGQSATQWFMFANPAVIPAFEIAFLRGNRVPVIESAQTSFNTLGIQWRIYDDWGVAEGDAMGVLKSTGEGDESS